MKLILKQFYDDMRRFSASNPIVVSYDKLTHELIYRQLNKLLIVKYLKPYYLPIKNFKLGILTPSGFTQLLSDLQLLLNDPELDKEVKNISFSIDKLCLNVYKVYNKVNLPDPQLYIEFKFVNIINPLLVWIIMNSASLETKALYKLLKNEERLNESQSNKQINQSIT